MDVVFARQVEGETCAFRLGKNRMWRALFTELGRSQLKLPVKK